MLRGVGGPRRDSYHGSQMRMYVLLAGVSTPTKKNEVELSGATLILTLYVFALPFRHLPHQFPGVGRVLPPWQHPRAGPVEEHHQRHPHSSWLKIRE